MIPMLAHRYADHRRKVIYPCHVQPKLNGVRMLHCQGVCQSRDGLLWHSSVVEHITSELEHVPKSVVLDGELYVHGWSLQRINSAVAIKRTAPSDSTQLVQYHVFDALFLEEQGLGFAERWQKLCAIMLPYSAISVAMVSTIPIYDEVAGDGVFAQLKRAGYEGMMYRTSDAPYGQLHNCGNKENRWTTLLKRKDWLDDEFKITDVIIGEGKYSNMVGSLELQMPNGKIFYAGSGLSDPQRVRYMDAPPIGCLAKIKYEMLSDDGIPLKPIIEVVYDE